jgi:hypothetical protein
MEGGDQIPMQSLYETVKEILDTGRLGVPVFVRCVAQIASGSERVEDVLARMLTMACSWLEASPLRVYAQSKDGSRQITATVHYVGGQTSIVSVNAAPGGATGVRSLMLLGNKGALYHDGEVLPPGLDMAAEPLSVPEWLVDAVGRSFRAGKPVIVEEVMDFE